MTLQGKGSERWGRGPQSVLPCALPYLAPGWVLSEGVHSEACSPVLMSAKNGGQTAPPPFKRQVEPHEMCLFL